MRASFAAGWVNKESRLILLQFFMGCNFSVTAGQSSSPDPACLASDTNCGEIVPPETVGKYGIMYICSYN